MDTSASDAEMAAVVERLGQIFDDANHAITVAATEVEDHPLIYVNRVFCDMAGHKADDLIGRNCRFLQGADTNRDYVAKVGAALRAGRNMAGILLNYRADQTAFQNLLFLGTVRMQGSRGLIIGCQNEALSPRDGSDVQGSLTDLEARYPRSDGGYSQYVWHAIESFSMRFEAVSQRVQIDPVLRGYLMAG